MFVWPAILHGKNLLLANFSTKFFHTYHAYRHHWLLPVCTAFTDLDLAWGSQVRGSLSRMIVYYCTLHFNTSLIDLGHDSRSHECWKAKTSAPVIAQSFLSIWMELSVLLKLVDVMNLIINLSYPLNVQEREPNLYDFVNKTLTLACIQIFTDQFLSNLAWW